MPHRSRGKSLHLDLPNIGVDDRPPLAALFLIKFDVKAGYTIVWKRASPGLELGDSVEFKSLPSGLHNVSEDLIYFMHGDTHAGISAFVNNSSEAWERNALMIAVGALVPLESGRLGRSWRHAPRLKEMAKELAVDIGKTTILEQYWNSNQPTEAPRDAEDEENVVPVSADVPLTGDSATRRSKRRARMKSMSSAYGVTGAFLAPMHPALALPKMIDTFGPLIFPLYKAALLRKRILLLNEAPVELACNFVYNISIISNIPSSVAELIPLEPLPYRLQPLFSIGVHDIDEVAGRSSLENGNTDTQMPTDDGFGWVACTTDHVLATKKTFFDVSVSIPPGSIHTVRQRAWPSMCTSSNIDVKASQRDLRRFRTLRQCQKRSAGFNAAASPYSELDEAVEDGPDTETSRLLPNSSRDTFDDASSTMDERLIEPMSWSALAYNSFMWWASAGEKRTDLEDEAEQDASLWRDFNSYIDGATPGSSRSRRRSSSSPHSATATGMSMLDGSAVPEMAIIGYFHRLTANILGHLATVVDSQDAERAEGSNGSGEAELAHANGNAKMEDSVVYVNGEEMTRMGLDVWSEGDRHFVEELVELYWGRTAKVAGGHIECCGVRIL